MDLSYYPGCSLESSAKEYNASARSICRELGINLKELDNWCCCGATSAHSYNQMLALALPARNLALAQDTGMDVAIPCAACYSRMKRADYAMRSNMEKRKQLEKMVSFNFTGNIQVMSLLEAITDKYGVGQVASKVKNPLTGLKLACYYGCLLLRPPKITQFDNAENPQSMDKLVKALGAEPVKWSYNTVCCGANLSITASDKVQVMVARILDMASEAGAQAIVTACPLCQTNLETRRSASSNQGIPIFYFTELIGLALALPDSSGWLEKHIVSPASLLQSLSLV